ncbi:CopG family ribbon-helix-helix protein [Halomonas sp. ATCH28]|uniref:CopG family ribbon-helix-helix protein n=1 Tax=Halomonas gemina TaxID=2945105 RepID=A0ABT0T5R0_9GAMM|nr:CopG family ribbon-helix-helix protein [Halomonas gemina]MCL7942255.1 CopG family ribbon-helix-helix protein [Halomonas gemina]
MTTPTSITLNVVLEERVQRLAEARRRPVDWLIHEAIEQYVEREEKQEAFNQDTLRAWEDYQATGLYATADEVEEWLASWGTDNETSPPRCHK